VRRCDRRYGRGWTPTAIVAAVVVLALPGCTGAGPSGDGASPGVTATGSAPAAALALPAPQRDGPVSLERALAQRRSVRDFTAEAITLTEAGQLLWAAQGITASTGGRSAPSAGALYPLEVLLVAGDVAGLDPGVYRYQPEGHGLLALSDGDLRAQLRAASLDQAAVQAASLSLVITGVYARTTGKYGPDRGVRFVHMEAGHVAQNVCLQAVALGLGAVTIGAVEEEALQGVLGLPDEEVPLYVLPVGRPA
jgi:SagB-type dehydrogenase family enzyme